MNLKLILAVGLMGASLASSAASLSVTNPIEVLALNGKKADNHVLSSLPVGQNQLIIEYAGLHRGNSKDKLYRSKPMVLSFPVENSSDSFKLTHKRYSDFSSVQAAFNHNKMGWKLSKNGGSAQPVELPILPGREGFRPYGDIEAVVREYNVSQGILLTSTGAMNVAESAVTVDESGKVEISGDAMTQLKLWYTKATKAERKAFRIWMIDQE